MICMVIMLGIYVHVIVVIKVDLTMHLMHLKGLATVLLAHDPFSSSAYIISYVHSFRHAMQAGSLMWLITECFLLGSNMSSMTKQIYTCTKLMYNNDSYHSAYYKLLYLRMNHAMYTRAFIPNCYNNSLFTLLHVHACGLRLYIARQTIKLYTLRPSHKNLLV